MTGRTTSAVEVTKTDLRLVNLLQWAPRITWGEARDILDVHPTTLSNRWERLTSTGIAWVNAQPTSSDGVCAFGFVSCAPAAIVSVAERLSQAQQVISVDIFTGKPALGITLLSPDVTALSAVITDTLGAIPEVTSVEVLLITRLHMAGDSWRLDVLRDTEVARAKAARDRDNAEYAGAGPLHPEHDVVRQLVRRNARITAAEVSRVTGLHPATARRHLHRVLAHDIGTVRCELAQGVSGHAVTVNWLCQLDPGSHAAAASALADDPRVRLIATLTGRGNFMVVMWLGAVADIAEAEVFLSRTVPDLRVVYSTATLRAVKRLGWLVEADGRRTGAYVPFVGGPCA